MNDKLAALLYFVAVTFIFIGCTSTNPLCLIEWIMLGIEVGFIGRIFDPRHLK